MQVSIVQGQVASYAAVVQGVSLGASGRQSFDRDTLHMLKREHVKLGRLRHQALDTPNEE